LLARLASARWHGVEPVRAERVAPGEAPQGKHRAPHHAEPHHRLACVLRARRHEPA
jgi:hypothetical protein